METNLKQKLRKELDELKDSYKKYKESMEDSEIKDKTLRHKQIRIGQHIKKSVLLLQEEGYSNLEIAKELDIPEKTAKRIIERS